MKIKLTARLRTADSPGHELRWPSRCWQQSVLQRSGTIKIVQCFTIFLNSLNIPTLILELNLLLFLQHLGGEMECWVVMSSPTSLLTSGEILTELWTWRLKFIHVPFVFYWVRKWELNRSGVRTRQIISGGEVSTHLYSVAGGVGGCGACELICPLITFLYLLLLHCSSSAQSLLLRGNNRGAHCGVNIWNIAPEIFWNITEKCGPADTNIGRTAPRRITTMQVQTFCFSTPRGVLGPGTRGPGGRTVNILLFFNNFCACFRLKPAHGRLHICFLWKTFPNNSSETQLKRYEDCDGVEILTFLSRWKENR